MDDSRRMRNALDMVITEREYQRQRWDSLNETRTPDEWVVIMSIYMGKLAREAPAYRREGFDHTKFEQILKELGALAVCGLEMFGSPHTRQLSIPKV